MDRYLVVQRVGDGLIGVAGPFGVLLLFYENDEAGVWVMVGFVLIGSVLSWIGQSRRDRGPVPAFDLEPMDGTGPGSECSDQ